MRKQIIAKSFYDENRMFYSKKGPFPKTVKATSNAISKHKFHTITPDASFRLLGRVIAALPFRKL